MPAPPPRLLLVTDTRRAALPLPALAAAAVEGGVDAIYLRHLRPNADWAAEVAAFRSAVGPGVLLMFPGPPPPGVANAGRHLRERDSPATPGDETGEPPTSHPRVSSLSRDLVRPSVKPRSLDKLETRTGGKLETRMGGGEATPAASRCGPAPGPLTAQPVVLSRSVHAPQAAARAAGVDYLVAGHVFPSASKPGKTPLGLSGLRAIVAAAPCPVVAIGGITPPRIPAVLAAGAAGVAVIGAICEARDPRAAARTLRAAVDAALALKGPTMDATTATNTITVTVNGKPRDLPAGSSVHDLLASRKLADSMAIVERNGSILPRDAYATTTLEPGDLLEVVHAVGGG